MWFSGFTLFLAGSRGNTRWSMSRNELSEKSSDGKVGSFLLFVLSVVQSWCSMLSGASDHLNPPPCDETTFSMSWSVMSSHSSWFYRMFVRSDVVLCSKEISPFLISAFWQIPRAPTVETDFFSGSCRFSQQNVGLRKSITWINKDNKVILDALHQEFVWVEWFWINVLIRSYKTCPEAFFSVLNKFAVAPLKSY